MFGKVTLGKVKLGKVMLGKVIVVSKTANWSDGSSHLAERERKRGSVNTHFGLIA